MKKVISLILVLLLALFSISLIACETEEEKDEKTAMALIEKIYNKTFEGEELNGRYRVIYSDSENWQWSTMYNELVIDGEGNCTVEYYYNYETKIKTFTIGKFLSTSANKNRYYFELTNNTSDFDTFYIDTYFEWLVLEIS